MLNSDNLEEEPMMNGLHTVALCESVDRHQSYVRTAASVFTVEYGISRKFCQKYRTVYKSYCSTVYFCRITSIYQPTNAHIISHKTLLKHFKTLRHVSILSDHHQGA